MKLCRFDENRLGLVDGDTVFDVTEALDLIPAMRYPAPFGDQLVAHLPEVLAAAARLKQGASRKSLSSVSLLSPVANPTKIINAPINYAKHIAESNADPGIKHGRSNITHISDWGLFLKATSSLVGFGEEIRLLYPERRNDHELELAIVIGRRGKNIPRAEARNYIAGYAMGLDMTTRGKELLSWRKSADTYALLGPWLTTADEIADPNALDLELKVNEETRQKANTSDLVYNVERLIEFASDKYTLYPGDIILTGTPEGVGPVLPGDRMQLSIAGLGTAEVKIAENYAGPPSRQE